MRTCIIGVSGHKGAGKDTIAKMITYIHYVGRAKASYEDFVKHEQNDYQNNFLEARITHFADSLKDCLSIIYNINREYFNDEYYKDKVWYCIKEHRFIKEEDLDTRTYYKFKPIDYSVNINEIGILIKEYPYLVVKLRTLMQYFGTDICRKHLGDDVWIDSTMIKANNIARVYGISIVSDVRFSNEEDALMKSSLYGGLIKVSRDIDEYNVDNHISETEYNDITGTYTIDNNGSRLSLFYKVLEVYQKIDNKI